MFDGSVFGGEHRKGEDSRERDIPIRAKNISELVVVDLVSQKLREGARKVVDLLLRALFRLTHLPLGGAFPASLNRTNERTNERSALTRYYEFNLVLEELV